MPFPMIDETFPSGDWATAAGQYAMNDAWWSGDQVALQEIYAAIASGSSSRGDSDATHYNKSDGTWRKGGIRGMIARMFNGAPIQGNEHRTRIHAPVASNLATLSSDLLMAEPPSFRLIDGNGDPVEGEAAKRLDKIMNSEDSHRTLGHAAEMAAGLSAVVLTAHWDRAVSDTPWMQATACDAAVPEFSGGRLAAINLYTTYTETERSGVTKRILVHVERHEPGQIIHGLLRVEDKAGKQIVTATLPLTERDETAHIRPVDGFGGIEGAVFGPVPNTVVLPTGIQSLTAQWWRNRPTVTFRKHGALAMMGRADFEGAEQILDAIDETWSSWMRDIKIARARLIVPSSFLDVQGPGLGGSFDLDREVLTPLEFTTLDGDGGKISAHQFEIRAEQHERSLRALTREIVQHAGYSMSTYGESSGDGGSVTATEVVDRTTLTERTRDKKLRYFAQAARPLALALLELDREHFRGPGIPAGATLDISWPELSQIDPEKEARVFQYLRAAMAVSTDTLVRERHPEWDEKTIQREVVRIQRENSLVEDDEEIVDDAAAEGRVDETADIAADDSASTEDQDAE